MTHTKTNTIAVVGAGIIGRGWIAVFAQAGCRVRVYDQDPARARMALKWFANQLEMSACDGLSPPGEIEPILNLVSCHQTLSETLDGVSYIQENVPEDLIIKKAVFSEIDSLANSEAIIASSTSGLDINEICEGLDGALRCITAHPCNPPHVIPVVEIVPTKEADTDLIRRAISFLADVGMKPVRLNYHIPDLLLNRIQSAVVREAIYLVESGVADVEAVDSVIHNGLGLRWALLGNFGVNNTNADGGIREYYLRYGQAYREGMRDLESTPPSFDQQLIEMIGAQVDQMEKNTPIASIARWRDRMILKIRALKQADPHPAQVPSATTEIDSCRT